MLSSTRRIHALDATTVDQIAAGEVVERPASVVKELVENALDSGAEHVEVVVEQGGLSRIAVVDDGCGMAAGEVALAVTRHATSKIASVHDLQAVASYGFRGEALSSVASISHLTLTTRRAGDDLATRLEVRGGTVLSCRPCGAPPGTSLEVRELFYNVPARRKFMRAPATEQAYVHDALLRCALGARRGAFRYSAGKRRLLDVPHDVAVERRPALLLGRRVRQLTAFAAEEGAVGDAVVLSGHLSPPLFERAGTGGLWLFVNGRFVRDRMLQRAVIEGYQLAYPGQFVAAVIFVDLPPGRVDVNVHPQKLEVRFDDAQATFRAVREAVAVWAAKLRAGGQGIGRQPTGRGRAVTGRETLPVQAAAALAPGRAGASSAPAAALPVETPAPNRGAAPCPLSVAGTAALGAQDEGGGEEGCPPSDASAAVRGDGSAPDPSAARSAGDRAALARIALASQRAFERPPRAAGRRICAPQGGSSPLPATLRPRSAGAGAALPRAGQAWRALTPLGLAPEGYLACAQGPRLVLVHLASAYGAWAARLLLSVDGAAPVLHRLLLPPTLQFASPHHEAVAALVAEAAADPSGGVLGVHLQPLGAARYLLQAVPACFADCAPEPVVAALVAASHRPGVRRERAARVASWCAALEAARAWPRTWGEGARWAQRLLAALDEGPTPVPMRAPTARVMAADGLLA